MKTKKVKKLLASIVCAALTIQLLGSYAPVSVMAAQTDETGLCEHHTEHNAECGYVEGKLCSHEHTDDCYKEKTNCVHVHTADCYADGWTEGEEAEPVNCSHTCSEEKDCITKELSCEHENNHDMVCGYVKAAACTYVCELCKPVEENSENSENSETLVLKNWKWDDKEKVLVDGKIILAKGSSATWADIKGALPASIIGTITVDNQEVEKTVAIKGWTHDSKEDIQDSTDVTALAAEQLVLTAELESGYTVEGKPSITIQLTGKTTLAGEVSYLDAEGKTQEHTATVINAGNAPVEWDTDANDGWYVVSGEVEIGSRIEVTGKVHLILENGCELEATEGITVSGTANGLTIYAQSTDSTKMGKLTATGDVNSAGIGGGDYGSGDNITINGGTVTATSSTSGIGWGAGIGGGNGGSGNNITINGGRVTATSNTGSSGFGAGIGGGYGEGGSGTNITINGGTVTATSCTAAIGHGAGIGGGWNGSGENITINGGTVIATSSTGGHGNGAGIGGGASGGSGSYITINGGEVTATSSTSGAGWGAGIGGGSGSSISKGNGDNITISGGTVTATSSTSGEGHGAGIGGGSEGGSADKLVFTGGSINASSVSITPTNGAATPKNVYLLTLANPNDETIAIDGKEWEPKNHTAIDSEDKKLYAYVTGGNHIVRIGDEKYIYSFNGTNAFTTVTSGIPYIDKDGLIQIISKETTKEITSTSADSAWTGTGDEYKNPGWYVVSGKVDIASRIEVTGNVHLILEDGCELNATKGITVSGTGNELAIYAQSTDSTKMGKLTATGDRNSAGIGGESDGEGNGTNKDGSNITINGGIIEATSTKSGTGNGAGIGGGNKGSGDNITINGGTVTATSSKSSPGNGAGIGGGRLGKGENITINGGTVTATSSTSDTGWGAGIGGGGWGGSGENIKITGGTVTATSNNGAGIGGGAVGGSASGLVFTGGSIKASSVGATPTTAAEGGVPVYLCKIYNPSNAAVITGGKSWTPVNHKAIDSNDNYLYAYVPAPNAGGDLTVTVGEKTLTFVYDADGFRQILTADDFTFTAPTSLAYDGNAKEATVAAKDTTTGAVGEITLSYYKKDNQGGFSSIDANHQDMGEYLVKISVAKGSVYAATTTDLTDENNWKFTIGKGTAPQPTISGVVATTSTISIDALADTATYGEAQYKIAKKGATGEIAWESMTPSNGKIVFSNLTADTAYIVSALYVGNANYEENSFSTEISTVAEAVAPQPSPQNPPSSGGTESGSGSSGGGNNTGSSPAPTPSVPTPVITVTIPQNPIIEPPASTSPTISQPKPTQGEDEKETAEPHIKGESGQQGWEAIEDYLKEASVGDTVSINMADSTTTVPGEVLSAICGKDVMLELDMGNGLIWSINGQNITADNLKDIDFGVTFGKNAGSSIPVDVINNVTGERYSINLTLAYEGEFGLTAVLSVNLEAKNAGLYANLFYYNEEAGELEFVCADVIDEDGNTKLTFTHASDYTIVIDAEPMDGTDTETEDAQTVGEPEEIGDDLAVSDETATDDSAGMMWLIIIVAIIAIGGFAVYAVKKKKETE